MRGIPSPRATLELHQIHAVTKGTDAQAEVTVRLRDAERAFNGYSADPDTLVASAQAYIHALNHFVDVHEQKGESFLPSYSQLQKSGLKA